MLPVLFVIECFDVKLNHNFFVMSILASADDLTDSELTLQHVDIYLLVSIVIHYFHLRQLHTHLKYTRSLTFYAQSVALLYSERISLCIVVIHRICTVY